MSRRLAGRVFFGVCIVLAALLLTKVISSVVAVVIFAIALAAIGILSRGFTID
jgi:hypothetical protein